MASVDPVYGVDVFEETKVLSESQTMVNQVLMILLNKPGFYPSIPWLGMDVQQYLYTFAEDIDDLNIKAKLATQCKALLPDIQDGELDVYSIDYEGHPLLIFTLPVLVDESNSMVTLGITVNDKGEMVYKFVANDKTQVL